MSSIAADRKNVLRAVTVAGLVALFLAVLLAQSGHLAGIEEMSAEGFGAADLQARFNMSWWAAYALSFIVVSALTVGAGAFYSALIASGVGVAVAVALAGVYWYLRRMTRKQIQAY